MVEVDAVTAAYSLICNLRCICPLGGLGITSEPKVSPEEASGSDAVKCNAG